ncbi:MAG: c-type cytochrome [Proteobacteria bacterium]|nr:c-type cytochrome [Pseudomonadota bacterium]MCL2308083.1 c-type cytochrome [Pseudomonadota bacterium]
MKKVLMLLPLAAFLATGAAYAESGDELLTKYRCGSCHKVDKKAIGPSYQDIAKKSAKDPNALEHLMKDVKKGSRGVWGNAPMPPQNVPDDDLKVMITYILSLKK